MKIKDRPAVGLMHAPVQSEASCSPCQQCQLVGMRGMCAHATCIMCIRCRVPHVECCSHSAWNVHWGLREGCVRGALPLICQA